MILVCALMLSVSGCLTPASNHQTKDYSDFAKCLTTNGMKIYGAAWCSHCNNIKARFGEAFKFITYQECDASFGGNPQACQDAGVYAYPAFGFGDEQLRFGELEFSVMAEKTGCELP